MISYSGDLDLRLVRGEDGKALTENGRSIWRYLGEPSCTWNGATVWLEKGGVTDFASMPRLVWGLLPPDGAWTLPAAFHDQGYKLKGEYARIGHPEPFTRKEVDQMFLAGMKAVGVSAIKRGIIYRAVRAGGGASWGS